MRHVPPLPEDRVRKAHEEDVATAAGANLRTGTDAPEIQPNQSPIRILLLGQSGSGKSTILRNLKFYLAPNAFRGDIRTWSQAQPCDRDGESSCDGIKNLFSHVVDEVKQLRMRLSPLQEVETVLTKELRVEKRFSGSGKISTDHQSAEPAVGSGSRWKAPPPLYGLGGQDQTDKTRLVITACCMDIISLWGNQTVKSIVSGHNKFQQQATTFFLDHVSRICEMGYEPTIDDISHIHLPTLGVEEHPLTIEGGQIGPRNREWVIYDVGGSRTQRGGWDPYFHNLATVVFVVPLSSFNQVLEEDTSVNRLFDSFQLWKRICSSKILADTSFIVIFNRQDILARKLEAGIQFSDFVTSYRGRPNDAPNVSKYIHQKFTGIHKELSPTRRPLFSHVTSAVSDRQASSILLIRVREIMLRKFLSTSEIL